MSCLVNTYVLVVIQWCQTLDYKMADANLVQNTKSITSSLLLLLVLIIGTHPIVFIPQAQEQGQDY